MSWRTRYATLRRVGPWQILLARGWLLARGDERLRRNCHVSSGQTVIDVGAYKGDFTAFARERWDATVIAVEPIPAFADALNSRFESDAAITIVSAALGASTGTIDIALAADGSSAWSQGEVIRVPLLDVADIVGDQQVALMKVNAEGAEFDVLERLIASGQITQIRAIQVQFHRFVPEARQRRSSIRRALKRTHRCAMNVPWVWEQWER